MMIEDEALRSQYKITSEERLIKLEAGLLHLERQVDNEAVLETLRREAHSLKGDSRRVALAAVTTLTQQVEDMLESLQNREISLTLEVSDRLHFGLNAINQLVYEAVTGESADVDMAQVLEQLRAPVLEATELAPDIASKTATASPSQTPPIPADDTPTEELQKIYKTTNQRRLQKLESGLLHLATFADDKAVLRELLQEIHRLKSDSEQMGLETMVIFSQQFENALKGVHRQRIVLSIELCAHLYEALQAMGQWLNTMGADTSVESNGSSPSTALMEAVAEPAEPLTAKIDTLLQSDPDISEDAELQAIYKNISEGRLQKLGAGLAQLEKHPDDAAILAALLREAHSLKGDSRSVGIHAVEILTHNFEDILAGIQVQEITLTPALSNSLYLGLDAIAQLVSEAFNRSSNSAEDSQGLLHLRPEGLESTAAAQIAGPLLSDDAAPPECTASSLGVDTPCPSETISVQISDLDALMIPVEDLTMTRIQIAQATAQLEQIAVLLEKGRMNRNQALSSSGLSANPHEEQLENLIATFRISAQANSAKLGLIAEDLREQIGALRGQPLAKIFQLLPPLVQDLAKQQSKQVALKIEGEETIVDKRILPEIQDALLHLIRNAIDHGVETPTERTSRHKPPTATIRLRGYQTDTGAVIEVTDDGRGLDIEQIKQTAIRRQLYRPEELAAMTTEQIQTLILAPGFSTRTVISEISGRGVGLDIVRTHIERLKGAVQIDSVPNQGCTFRLLLSSDVSECEVCSNAITDPWLAL